MGARRGPACESYTDSSEPCCSDRPPLPRASVTDGTAPCEHGRGDHDGVGLGLLCPVLAPLLPHRRLRFFLARPPYYVALPYDGERLRLEVL